MTLTFPLCCHQEEFKNRLALHQRITELRVTRGPQLGTLELLWHLLRLQDVTGGLPDLKNFTTKAELLSHLEAHACNAPSQTQEFSFSVYWKTTDRLILRTALPIAHPEGVFGRYFEQFGTFNGIPILELYPDLPEETLQLLRARMTAIERFEKTFTNPNVLS